MVSVRYLLNQWMDFDQTYIDTLLEGGKELIKFGDLDLIFTVTVVNVQNMASVCYLLNQLIDFDRTLIDTLLED